MRPVQKIFEKIIRFVVCTTKFTCTFIIINTSNNAISQIFQIPPPPPPKNKILAMVGHLGSIVFQLAFNFFNNIP